MDITDEAAVAAAVQRIVAALGRIDALVHVAGGFEMGEGVAQMTRASWDRMFDAERLVLRRLAKPVVAQMRAQGGGSVVAVSAAAAGGGQALKGAYIASKSALQRLVESLAAGTGRRRHPRQQRRADHAGHAGQPRRDARCRPLGLGEHRARPPMRSPSSRRGAGAAVHGQHLKLGA